MKVVLLMSCLTMGGAERVAISLSNYMVKNDIEVHLVSFDKQKPAYSVDDKVRVWLNQENETQKRLKGIRQRIEYTKNILKQVKPDLIFTMFYQTALYALYARKALDYKVKVISSERGNPLKRSKLARFLGNTVSAHCDGFIFQTKRVQKAYRKSVIKKSTVIPNPVSNPLVSQIDEKAKRSEKTVTTMGRLTTQKGFDTLISAFSLLDPKFSEYRLLIYGEGPERKNLELKIQNLHLQSRVFLKGNDKNALKEIAKSQVFIMTSRYEGMPNALMEAMSIGMPVIATDCEFGPRELIQNGKNGLLVEVDNQEAIRVALETLLQNEKLRDNFSKEAQKINTTHSVDCIFSKYCAYFEQVLKKEQ